MEIILIKAVQLILAFAILVIIHEFGHFLFARIFGIKVEKFYIFFNPWTSLFKWKPKKYWGFLKKKHYFKNATPCDEDADGNENQPSSDSGKKHGFWSDTEYGIGWLPLGGYCKIAGMIDESMDKEQMQKPPQDWEFRSKPAWQRLLVMIAGVLFNFLLAILIYAGIVYATGEKYVPLDKTPMGMAYSGEAQKIGFRNGDIPLEADGKALSNPFKARVAMVQAQNVKVLRNGKDTVNIAIPSDFMLRMDEEAKSDTATIAFFTYRIPTRIIQIQPGDGADKGGLHVGDEVIAINDVATPDLFSFRAELDRHPSETINVRIVRKSENAVDTINAPVKLSEGAKMGVGLEIDPSAFFPSENKRYNLIEAVPRGIEMGTDRLVAYAASMKMVFTKEGAKSVGGFGSIGSIFPEKWNWIAFWNIAAFLSVALAFMNILPIPALDGGHVLFLLYEVVFRRKPSEKFLEYAQITGMILLIALLIYANGMDIVRLFK